MSMNTQLYQGEYVRLGPINYEKDPKIESEWTHNSDYLHTLGLQLPRPLSAAQVKKRYEVLEKEIDKSKNAFYFTIRNQEDDTLLGFVRLFWIEWSNGTAWLQIVTGNPDERDQPYAREALELVLQFAFQELNLYRVSALSAEDDPAGIEMLKNAGFAIEVRRRKTIQRGGQICDQLLLGLLGEDWTMAEEKTS